MASRWRRMAGAAGGAVLAGILGCGTAQFSEDAAFERAVEVFLQAAYRQHPVWATEMGFHEVDGKIDDLSPAGRAARLEWLRDERRRFAAFRARRLGRDARLDREILLQHIDGEIFEISELRAWENNPLLYTHLAGNCIDLLLARDFAPLAVRLESARRRLLALPAFLDQARANLRHPSRVHTETAIRQTRGLVPLIQDELLRAAAGTEVEPALRAAAGPARLALEDYQRFLEEDLRKRSDGDFRLGRDLFDRKLRYTLGTSLASREIRRRADAERERVRQEMFELAWPLYRQFWPDSLPPGSARDPRTGAMVRAVLGRIAQDGVPPGELLDACRAAVDSLTRFVTSAHLLRLDPAPALVVEWTPAFAAGAAVAGLEAPGPLERDLPSFYRVQPLPSDWTPEQVQSYLREYNRWMLQVLSMHEAVPGHFVQHYYSNRGASRVRSLFPSAPFVEGWAVYGERLVVDAGYMHGDPRLALEQRKFYLRTVLNASLDIGVHCEGMGESEAVRLLTEKGFQEEAEARAKWVRAQLTSTQLCTYFAGLQEILDLQAADRARRGAAWSRADFDTRLLSHGSPPIRFLRALLLES